MLSIFSCVCWVSIGILLRNVCLDLFPTFWWACLFFWYWVVWAACIFWKLILSQLFHLKLFSPILRVVFSPCILYIYNILHCCVKAFKYNQVPLVYFCLYFHYSRRWVFYLCFPLRVLQFLILHLGLYSILSLFWGMVLGSVLILSFTRSCLIFSAPFIEESFFVPLYILALFVKNKISINTWVYFCAFYLAPLVYISVFVPVPYCLDMCSL